MARKKTPPVADAFHVKTGTQVGVEIVDAIRTLPRVETIAEAVVRVRGTRVQPIPRVDPEVREVDGSRSLFTIGPNHPVWMMIMGKYAEGGAALKLDFLDGAGGGGIVRIQPPLEASVEHVEWVRAAVIESGAQVVRVMPRRTTSVLPQAREPVEHKTARQVVEKLVAEAHVEDRGALETFCAGVMERQRL